MYEKIFGTTFVSVGGEDTTRQFTEKLQLQEGMKVLDIGCGIGGSAFYLAERYGVDVHGVDLSKNMIDIALEYRMDMKAKVKHRVQFYVEDAITMEYPEGFYDTVYSRDTILHIAEKPKLFRKFFESLKAGGRVLISDYCRGDRDHTERFKKYVESRDYKLKTVQEYKELLEQAGFTNVVGEDVSGLMLQTLQSELIKFEKMKESFIRDFDEDGFNYIKQGWEAKIVRCNEGDQAWGFFSAEKP